MSTYPTDDPVQSTPIFDETMHSGAYQVDPGDTSSSSTGDQAKQAAGQAKDTVQDAAGAAKDQAKAVGDTATDAGKKVASTTKEQASKVASDAVSQARDLYGQATTQLSDQAGKQQKNAASTLRTFGEDLSSMGQQQNGGLAAELVHTLSQRASRTAEWLEAREPGEVLDEVKQFAARRPGLFIGLAAVAGIVAARATKALVADAKSDDVAPSAGTAGFGTSTSSSTSRTGGIGYADIDSPTFSDTRGTDGTGYGDIR